MIEETKRRIQREMLREREGEVPPDADLGEGLSPEQKLEKVTAILYQHMPWQVSNPVELALRAADVLGALKEELGQMRASHRAGLGTLHKLVQENAELREAVDRLERELKKTRGK
jgi:hypothetical protein